MYVKARHFGFPESRRIVNPVWQFQFPAIFANFGDAGSGSA
jgi:hypothetical protein